LTGGKLPLPLVKNISSKEKLFSDLQRECPIVPKIFMYINHILTKLFGLKQVLIMPLHVRHYKLVDGYMDM